jgi:hypothetical protein
MTAHVPQPTDRRRRIAGAALVTAAALSCTAASALTINPVTSGEPTGQLVPALLAPDSGINIQAAASFQGSLATGQAGTYSGFVLAPSTGSTPTLTLPDGIVLTSGTADLPLTNTVNNFNPLFPPTGSNAALATLAGLSIVFDANAIGFAFTVDSGNAVSAQFVFGTDEFPTQAVTDIFGFFVDGVNYAQFPSGELISNTPGNPTNFISNPVGSGLYGIEYNGLSQAFTVTGLLNPNFAVHTIEIAIADTSDRIFDSGVFIGGLKAATASTGGIGDPTPVVTPEPTGLAVIGFSLAGLFAIARRPSRRAGGFPAVCG